MGQTPSSSDREAVLAEQRDLRDALARLQDTDNLAALVDQLSVIRALLEDRFAREEGDDGFTKAIGQSAPLHLNRLAKLFRAHPRFLRTIDKLTKRTHDVLMGPIAGIQSDVRSLCRELEVHEAAKTEVVTDAVFTDIGTAG